MASSESPTYALPADIVARKDIDASAKIVLTVMKAQARDCGVSLASDGFLAGNCGLSRPTVIKARAELEVAKLIEKDGEPIKQVHPYRFLHPAMAATDASTPQVKTQHKAVVVETKAPQCKNCFAQRPLDRMGVCPVCRKQDQADAEVRTFLKNSPGAAYELVYLGLKANGSHCGAKDLQRAYRRVTTPLKRGKTA